MDVAIPQDFLGEEGDGELVEWLVDDGDSVSVDQEIAQIETAKVTVALLSPASGVISLITEAGSTVEHGEVVARIA